MWTQVVNLIRLELTDEETEMFADYLLDLNDWLRRQYGPRGLTCEEVSLAYNHLVMEELRKDDGRVLEAYPRLDTRHIGEVLAAYRRLVDTNTEVRQVLSQEAYLPPPTEPDPTDINAFMEQALSAAIAEVRRTGTFYDTGNGLYSWLYQQGRIKPSVAEALSAREEAEKRVRVSLAEQKQTAATRTTGDYSGEHLRSAIGKRLANVLNATGDHNSLVREEAARIWLVNYLRQRAGISAPAAPPAPKPATGPKPFSHSQYIETLKEQLPVMGDEQVSDLQRQARQRNVLDVYELTTAEWLKRFPAKSSKKHVSTTQPKAPAQSKTGIAPPSGIPDAAGPGQVVPAPA